MKGGFMSSNGPDTKYIKKVWPYPYGSDLHWLWGWGERIDNWLVNHGELPNLHLRGIFHPDRLADKAITRLSDRFPRAFSLIDGDLARVEKYYEEQDGSESKKDELNEAMIRLCNRIWDTARLVADVCSEGNSQGGIGTNNNGHGHETGGGGGEPELKTEIHKLDKETPALNTKDGTWVKTSEAAELLNVSTNTLATYRSKGPSTRDKMFGVDLRDQKWRRKGSQKSHVWYLKTTLNCE